MRYLFNYCWRKWWSCSLVFFTIVACNRTTNPEHIVNENYTTSNNSIKFVGEIQLNENDGYIFNNDNIELSEELQHNGNNDNSNGPMNNINITRIILPNNDGGREIIELNDDSGSYTYNFGQNRIYINYFKRNVKFDPIFMYQNAYDPDFFESLDRGINKEIIDFPHWYFNDNMRKQVINNVIIVDSFKFYAQEHTSQLLYRTLFISTENYNITLAINIPAENIKELYDMIVSEVPEYFIIDLNARHPDFIVMWRSSDSIVDFGNELINENHKSITATDWYRETERLINGLSIE